MEIQCCYCCCWIYVVFSYRPFTEPNSIIFTTNSGPPSLSPSVRCSHSPIRHSLCTLFSWKIRHQHFIMHPVNKSWIEFALRFCCFLPGSLSLFFNRSCQRFMRNENRVECVDTNKRGTNEWPKGADNREVHSDGCFFSSNFVYTTLFFYFWFYLFTALPGL